MPLSSKRLRWACRRGMLELDLLLLPFFDAQYAQLSVQDQASFEQLLSEEDVYLHEMLVLQGSVPPPYAHLISAIIAQAQSLSGLSGLILFNVDPR